MKMINNCFLPIGKHIFVDFSKADYETLDNADILEKSLIYAAMTEGVTVLGTIKKRFSPSGVTILLLLAESHVSLHTYPEEGKAFFDAFTCGEKCEPKNIFLNFAQDALPGNYLINQINRGSTQHTLGLLNRHDIGPGDTDIFSNTNTHII